MGAAAVRTAVITMGTAVRAAMRTVTGRRRFQFFALGVIIGDALFRTPGYFVAFFVIEFGMIVHFVILLPLCVHIPNGFPSAGFLPSSQR